MKNLLLFSFCALVISSSCETAPLPAPPKPILETVNSLENEVVAVNIDSAEFLLVETDMTDNIIRNRRFGEVNTGMPIMELRNLFSEGQIKDSFLLQEGDTVKTVFIYDEAHEKVLFEMFPDDSLNAFVEWLHLYDPAYATIQGIGVGSTAKEIASTGLIDEFLVGEDCLLVYLFDMPETAFVFDFPEGFVPPDEPTEGDMSILPDSAKVVYVYSFVLSTFQ